LGQGNHNTEIFIAIVAGTTLFLLFAGFIIAYIMINWKRKLRHIQEVEKMKMVFNEELLKSRLEIQEETFNNISQEIHDNVGQMLSLAKVQLNIMDQSKKWDEDKLTELKETINHAMTDLRDIAKSLSTERIKSFDLSESLKYQINRINRGGLVTASFAINGVEQKIEDRSKLILFRMIQEVLQNIIKHSKATKATIEFNYAGQLDIIISDNGTGFDVNKATQQNEGMGLQNIVQRAALIGGNASVSSTIGEGTIIKINIPYA